MVRPATVTKNEQLKEVTRLEQVIVGVDFSVEWFPCGRSGQKFTVTEGHCVLLDKVGTIVFTHRNLFVNKDGK